MTANDVSVIGGAIGSINASIPATAVRCSPVDPDEPNGGQAYLPYVQLAGHTVLCGVAVADLLSMRVLKYVPLADEPSDIAMTPDGNYIYLPSSDVLFSVQTDTFAVTSLPLEVPTGAIAAAPATTFEMGLLGAVAVSADGSQLLVAGQQMPNTADQHCYLALFDIVGKTVKKAITDTTTDFFPHNIALTPDGRYAIANLGMNGISIIDLESFTIKKTVLISPNAVIALAVDPASKFVYVAAGPYGGSTGSVEVLDLDILEIVKSFPLPSAPHQLAVSPDGRSLLVIVGVPDGTGVDGRIGLKSMSLVVLDADLGTQSPQNPPIANAGPFAIDPVGQRVFVFDSVAEVLNVFELNS